MRPEAAGQIFRAILSATDPLPFTPRIRRSRMGILADPFVATPPEAAVYEEILLRNIAVAEQYDPALRGLTDLNFSILWAMLLKQ